jgi:hypothetical protein
MVDAHQSARSMLIMSQSVQHARARASQQHVTCVVRQAHDTARCLDVQQPIILAHTTTAASSLLRKQSTPGVKYIVQHCVRTCCPGWSGGSIAASDSLRRPHTSTAAPAAGPSSPGVIPLPAATAAAPEPPVRTRSRAAHSSSRRLRPQPAKPSSCR